MAHLFRARSQPDPPCHLLSPAGRQDAGLRLSRGPPAHAPHPRPRGGPGGHRHRPGLPAERRAHRGHRPRTRLRTRPGRARERGRARPVPARRVSTTRPGVPASRSPRSTCAPRRSTASPTTAGRARPRRHPRARSSAGPTASPTSATTGRTPCWPASWPRTSSRRPSARWCGERRSAQLGAFIAGVVSATLRSGQVGMEEEEAEALAAFRSCNYERIYLREASLRQGDAVVSVLRGLVEHFSDRPHLVSDHDRPRSAPAPPRASTRMSWRAAPRPSAPP